MKIRTPGDLGALIRERRIKLGLDQRSLALKAGTSRQWVVAVEKGKSGAAIGLILRTLQALKVSLEMSEGATPSGRTPSKNRASPPVDINRILSSLRKPRK